MRTDSEKTDSQTRTEPEKNDSRMSKPSENGQDPKGRPDHTIPIRADDGFSALDRWIAHEVSEGRISGDELKILLVVADETSSWSRPFVRLTNAQMADRAGMNKRAMRRVRKRLLDDEDGEAYLVRRRDPEDERRYLYGLSPPQWWREQEIGRETIRRLATPENGS